MKKSNWITFTTGLPGSGKSLAAIAKAWQLDGRFNNHNGVFNRTWSLKKMFWSAKAFVQAVKKEKKFTYLIWDDAGEVVGGANARKFYSEWNLLISSLFQVMRFKEQWIEITLPAEGFFDAQARRIAHASHIVKGHDNKASFGLFKVHDFWPESGKVLMKYLRFFDERGVYVVRKSRVPLPPKELVDEYKEISEAQKDEWLNYYSDKIEELKDTRVETEKSVEKAKNETLEAVRNNIEKFTTSRGLVSKDLIKYDLNVPPALANYVAMTINKELKEKKLIEKGDYNKVS